MGNYRLDAQEILPIMRQEAKDVVEQLKYGYKEDHTKVGRPKSEFEFEELEVRLPQINEKGHRYISSSFPVDHIEYNLLLKVYFPLKGMSFEATDVHTYRWNSKHNYFEHEDTEIL